MAINIDIKPEVQAELSRQAAAHGVDIFAYAASLLEEAAQISSVPKKLNPREIDETLRELAQFSEKIPVLPDEAFSRENLYRDHD
jgi:S-adenosylmethionine hydrolase